LLVGKLPQLAVRSGGEGFADEIVNVQRRQGYILAFARHPVGQIHGQLQARMGADQIGIV